MTISDIDDPTGCSFFIAHPTKSFVIVAESREVKTLWLRDTFQTIVSCRKREALRANGLRKMSIIDRIEGQQKSGLSQAPREREREGVPKTHPHPIPCLNIPRQGALSAFASPSSKNLIANEGSSVFPPALASTSFEISSAFSPPMLSPSKRNTPRLNSLTEDGDMDKDRIPSPMLGRSDISESSDVFATIMQMATLHMDEVELLSIAGEISPESLSGVNTPEKRRRSSTDSLKGLPDMAQVALQLDGSATDNTGVVVNPIRPESPFHRRAQQRENSMKELKVVVDTEGQQALSIKRPDSPNFISAADEKSAFQKRAARTFETRISELPEKSLLGLFNAVSSCQPHLIYEALRLDLLLSCVSHLALLSPPLHNLIFNYFSNLTLIRM